MLRFGRWLASLLRRTNVSLVEAGAEAIPLPDASATVVWSLSAVHHWSDRAAGLAEAERVLVRGVGSSSWSGCHRPAPAATSDTG